MPSVDHPESATAFARYPQKCNCACELPAEVGKKLFVGKSCERSLGEPMCLCKMQLETQPGTKKNFVRNKAIPSRAREPAALSIYAPLRRFQKFWWLRRRSCVHTVNNRGRLEIATSAQGGPVKLDSMWQHRLTRLVRDRYMYSIRITV